MDSAVERLRRAQFRDIVETLRVLFQGRNAGALHTTTMFAHSLTCFYTTGEQEMIEVVYAERKLYHHYQCGDADHARRCDPYDFNDFQRLVVHLDRKLEQAAADDVARLS